MKTSFKKLVAGASIVALVTMNALMSVNAATPTAVIGATTITITSAGNTASEAVTLVLKQNTVTKTITTDYTVDTTVAGTILITTTATLQTLGAVTPANYQISYVTAAGVAGAVVVNNIAAGTAGSHAVTVTAYVLPILSMSLNTPTINFGELVPTIANPQSVIVTTTSNAKGGIVVSAASTGLATGGATGTDKYIGALARTGLGGGDATTGTDSYQIASTSAGAGTDLVIQDVGASQNVLSTTNVADSNTTTTVTLTATADTQTEAGNYNDTLTFTVTGTF